MTIPAKPAYLSPEMRLQEVANILARGIVRMRDKNAQKQQNLKEKQLSTCNPARIER